MNIEKETNSSENDDEKTKKNEDSLESRLLEHVANSSATFKLQHKNDPELSLDEKIKIAAELLKKSHSQFLFRFGTHLNLELLEYFSKNYSNEVENYEVNYHISRLKRYFNRNFREIDKKNRRYEALKMLVQKGEYFSEVAMMKRNPLLYDELIGKYLTEKEIESRDTFHDKTTSFVTVLMEGIERDLMKKLKEQQKDAEDEVMEENDTDSESDDDASGSETDSNCEITQSQHHVPSNEIKEIFKKEFVSQMYQSFVNGKDDFDYSTIDDNEEYDNIELRSQDEEEKYFDSESPELIIKSSNVGDDEGQESEDELDKYIKSLKNNDEVVSQH